MTTTDKKRILFVHRYFWPDVAPYASILRAIAGHFSREAHEVTVVAGRPGYRGQNIPPNTLSDYMDGFRVKRVWLFSEKWLGAIVKGINALLMATKVFVIVVREKPDIVVASTAPPFFLSGASALACRLTGSRFIYHCMDIHPEIGCLQGHFRQAWLRHALVTLDGWICRSAWRVIVLSIAMKETLLSTRLGLLHQKVYVINNPALPVFNDNKGVQAIPEVFSQFRGRRIIFAGNIGRFQSLDSLVLTFRELEFAYEVGLFIVGSGSEAAKLKALAGESNGRRVFFLGQQKPGMVNDMISKSCASIVSIQRGVDKYAFPSKLTNYLAHGCPVLVISASDSYLQTYVHKNSLGWLAEQGNLPSITSAVKGLLDTDALKEKSLQVKRFYDKELSLQRYLMRWDMLIKDEK